jgi:hypothetical protein
MSTMALDSRAFPGGITDSAGNTGFVNLPGDEIVAVDLTTGDMRWRVAGAGRPLLAADSALLVVRRQQRRLELILLDAVNGEVRNEIGPLPVPDWAADQWDTSGGFVAVAQPQGSQSQVTWRAVKRYQGGAAPTAEVLAGAGDEAGGTVLVDLDAGRMHAVQDVDPSVLGGAELGERAQRTTSTGGRVYRLDSKPFSDGTTVVTLTASREGDEVPLWETVLDRRGIRRRPPPLRQ